MLKKALVSLQNLGVVNTIVTVGNAKRYSHVSLLLFFTSTITRPSPDHAKFWKGRCFGVEHQSAKKTATDPNVVRLIKLLVTLTNNSSNLLHL